jgi:hypothetical protein
VVSVSAAHWVSAAALLLAGCASIWGFEDLRSSDGGTGGKSSIPGLTGGRSAGGQTANAGATGTGGAVLACQRNCVAPCTDCPASYCTDLDSDPKNCGACGTACLGGRICTGGKCACAADFLLCQGADLVDACFDPASDPKHCGDCESACESDGLCVGGNCEYPQDLATDQGSPRALALDSSYVYFSTGTEIRRVPLDGLDGGEEPETLANAGVVDAIEIEGDSLYWVDTTASQLLRLSLDGGEATELIEAVAPAPFAVYEREVYFLQNPVIYAVPIDGGARRSLGMLTADAESGVFVNDDGVYVSFQRAFMLYDHEGATSTLFAVRDGVSLRQFTVYGDTLYYTTGSAVESVQAGANYGHSLSSEPAYLLAVDGDDIVFTGSGGIRALPTADDGSPSRLLSADNPTDIAVQGDYVYWTRAETAVGTNDGKIRRVRR